MTARVHPQSLIALGIATIACLLMSAIADAAPITVPTDLNLGDKFRLVFVTSTTRDATSINIADYNSFVTGVANGVTELDALGTTWNVIGSTSTDDARDNTGTNPSTTGVPIYHLGDTRIAEDNADLWDGSLLATINSDENGSPLGAFVWTGTTISGTAVPFEALGDVVVTVGLSALPGPGWVDDESAGQSNLMAFYAMSGELTVVPEPEPSTGLFVSLGLLGAMWLAGGSGRSLSHRRR